MSYKFFNTNTQKTSFIDLPNCEIKTDSLKYIVKDGIIKVFNLINGKIEKGDKGSEIQQISLSQNQLSIFESVKERDNYTDRLDCDDLSDLDEDFKSILMGTYGDKKTTRLKQVKVSENKFKYKAKNRETKEIESLEVQLEKNKKSSRFSRTWLGRLFSGKDKPKVMKYTSHEMTYTIKEGDSLKIIAKKFDLQYEDLLKINPDITEGEELKAGAKINLPKTKHKTKVYEDNVVKIPKIEYTVREGESPATIANDHDISLYRLAEANKKYVKTDTEGNIVFDTNGNINFKSIPEGAKLVIPEHKTVTKLSELTIKAISEEVGVSEAYIQDILFGIEGRHDEPDLEAYDDKVPPANMTNAEKEKHKKNGWAIGTPTIGFGHTGRVHGVHMGRKTSDWQNVKITKEEAYLILANDIFMAKQDAMAYIGEEAFNRAPQSIQDALTDIVFNKGVAGFKRKKSPCLNLKEDMANKDYVSAAADMVVDPTVPGLMRRNIYRVLVATRDLPDSDRQAVLDRTEDYKNKTKSQLKNKTLIKELEEHWTKARENNAAHGFFIR